MEDSAERFQTTTTTDFGSIASACVGAAVDDPAVNGCGVDDAKVEVTTTLMNTQETTTTNPPSLSTESENATNLIPAVGVEETTATSESSKTKKKKKTVTWDEDNLETYVTDMCQYHESFGEEGSLNQDDFLSVLNNSAPLSLPPPTPPRSLALPRGLDCRMALDEDDEEYFDEDEDDDVNASTFNQQFQQEVGVANDGERQPDSGNVDGEGGGNGHLSRFDVSMMNESFNLSNASDFMESSSNDSSVSPNMSASDDAFSSVIRSPGPRVRAGTVNPYNSYMNNSMSISNMNNSIRIVNGSFRFQNSSNHNITHHSTSNENSISILGLDAPGDVGYPPGAQTVNTNTNSNYIFNRRNSPTSNSSQTSISLLGGGSGHNPSNFNASAASRRSSLSITHSNGNNNNNSIDTSHASSSGGGGGSIKRSSSSNSKHSNNSSSISLFFNNNNASISLSGGSNHGQNRLGGLGGGSNHAQNRAGGLGGGSSHGQNRAGGLGGGSNHGQNRRGSLSNNSFHLGGSNHSHQNSIISRRGSVSSSGSAIRNSSINGRMITRSSISSFDAKAFINLCDDDNDDDNDDGNNDDSEDVDDDDLDNLSSPWNDDDDQDEFGGDDDNCDNHHRDVEQSASVAVTTAPNRPGDDGDVEYSNVTNGQSSDNNNINNDDEGDTISTFASDVMVVLQNDVVIEEGEDEDGDDGDSSFNIDHHRQQHNLKERIGKRLTGNLDLKNYALVEPSTAANDQLPAPPPSSPPSLQGNRTLEPLAESSGDTISSPSYDHVKQPPPTTPPEAAPPDSSPSTAETPTRRTGATRVQMQQSDLQASASLSDGVCVSADIENGRNITVTNNDHDVNIKSSSASSTLTTTTTTRRSIASRLSALFASGTYNSIVRSTAGVFFVTQRKGEASGAVVAEQQASDQQDVIESAAGREVGGDGGVEVSEEVEVVEGQDATAQTADDELSSRRRRSRRERRTKRLTAIAMDIVRIVVAIMLIGVLVLLLILILTDDDDKFHRFVMRIRRNRRGSRG